MEERVSLGRPWRAVLLACACAVLAGGGAGCADSSERTKATGQPQATNEAVRSSLVDAVTGRQAVDAGRRARAKIEAVSAQRQDDLDEVVNP